MARSFLESALAGAAPTFAREWEARRRAYPPGADPAITDFLGALRTHVLQLLAEGRVAETARVFLTVERLLTDADPVLEGLLSRDFLRALADDCRATGIDARRVVLHLGPRSRRAWET